MRPLLLPPLRRTVKDARNFAMHIHSGQVDKAGESYGNHLSQVDLGTARAMRARGQGGTIASDEARQVAWLHDVLENDPRPYGPVTLVDLVSERFEDSVVRRVSQLTRSSDWKYPEWIRWLAETADPITLLVKIADLEDNADPERLRRLPPGQAASLAERYGEALSVLRRAARDRTDSDGGQG